MKIVLLDINNEMTEEWKRVFKGFKDVEIVCDYFHNYLNNHDVECIVSPANSYGLMDGGYDLAITRYFGKELAKTVQNKIIKEHFGEQVVGTSLIVDIPGTNKKLIHTPSMRVPSFIKDPMIVYYCMRSTLMCAIKNNVKSIIIPAFGGATGDLSPDVIAIMMSEAYKQIKNPPKELGWDYAVKRHLENII